METRKYAVAEAWLIGDETEKDQSERLSSFLDDFFDFCSERLAFLINSGEGKRILSLYVYPKSVDWVIEHREVVMIMTESTN